VIFSTDMYSENSVKSVERIRRGCGEKLIVSGVRTKRQKDWNSFMTNDDNKKQLTQVLLNSWNSVASAVDTCHCRCIYWTHSNDNLRETSYGESTLFCSTIPQIYSGRNGFQSSLILYVCKRPRIQGCESKKPGQTFFYSIAL